MRKNNCINLKIDFEGIPIINQEFYGLKEVEKAWENVRRKLK